MLGGTHECWSISNLEIALLGILIPFTHSLFANVYFVFATLVDIVRTLTSNKTAELNF